MADEERKPIYDAYVAYSKSWISIWVVPFLCTDDETLARHYLPYLLEGDPEEPTELNIQEYLTRKHSRESCCSATRLAGYAVSALSPVSSE